MEKDFFHFRRQYPITKKKKTRVCVTQFDTRNSSISFETRIELKIVSFTFESNFPIQEFARTCHQLVTKSIARRGWFSKNRILEFPGAVIFTPYFSISIRREGKGCIPNAPPGICAHVRAHWVQCTWPNWKVDTLEFSGRKGGLPPTSSHPLSHLVRLLSRHPRRAVVESCSGYDESHLSWSRSYSIPPVHRIFAYLNEREKERKKEKASNFSNGVASIEWVIINSLTRRYTVFSLWYNYFILRDIVERNIYGKWKNFKELFREWFYFKYTISSFAIFPFKLLLCKKKYNNTSIAKWQVFTSLSPYCFVYIKKIEAFERKT